MSRTTTAFSLRIRYAGGVGEPDLISALDPFHPLPPEPLFVLARRTWVALQTRSIKVPVPRPPPQHIVINP